jgi:hypothetical protein
MWIEVIFIIIKSENKQSLFSFEGETGWTFFGLWKIAATFAEGLLFC